MKGIFIEKYGPPRVLREKELEDPRPAPEEVLIEVDYSGINFADLLQRLGRYGNAPSLPYVPGFEVSGRVLETGSKVSTLRKGDGVVAMSRFGGYAEKVCAAESQCRKIPSQLDPREAAAIPVNFLTAYFCLFNMGNLRKGETVLVQGGAGGVGTAAVQLALLKGARIFATAGSPEKIEFLNELGVEKAINYKREKFSARVREDNDGKGIDLLLDAVGGETLREGYELLEPLGRLVSYGLSAAAPSEGRSWGKTLLALWRTPAFKPLDLIGRNVGIFGFHLGLLETKQDEVSRALDQLIDWICQGEVRPIIDRIFPLDRAGAVEAHRYIHERRNIGKVLLARDK